MNIYMAEYWAKRKLIDEGYLAKRKLIDESYLAKLKLLDEEYKVKLKLLDEELSAAQADVLGKKAFELKVLRRLTQTIDTGD